MGKWKKKSAEKEENNEQLEALDLEVKFDKEPLSEFEEKPVKN